MDPRLRALLDVRGGLLCPADVDAAGLSRKLVTASVGAGELVRLRRGVLVDGETWRACPPWGRHALRARGVAREKMPGGAGPYAFSHHSALSLLGVGSHAVDDRVHLVRTDGRRTNNDGLIAAHPPLDRRQTTVCQGLPVVLPAVAALQVAARFGVEAGLVSADAVLHLGQAERADLLAARDVPGLGPNTTAPGLVAEMADPLRESAGESRAWWLFCGLGLPEPELQVNIVDRCGSFLGRVDFLWRSERVVGEFDGLLKYDSPDALHAEKWRQDRFGDEGYEVFRLGWADLERPRLVRARALAAFARADARR